MSSLDEMLAPKDRFLRDNESAYLIAKEYIKSEAYTAAEHKVLKKIEAVMVHSETSHEKALWLLGRIRQILDDLREPEAFITEYESTQKSVREMRQRQR